MRILKGKDKPKKKLTKKRKEITHANIYIRWSVVNHNGRRTLLHQQRKKYEKERMTEDDESIFLITHKNKKV
jgi:outer membrane translocation and assembly module TamA